MEEILERELSKVRKPAFYLPLEMNLNVPKFDEREVKFVFTYPDLYEVGFSHIGTKIIYNLLNRVLNFTLCHRAYLPAPDMQEFMAERGIPLYTIEALKPVKSYDVWGFTLQSELTFTNLLRCLSLAGIPLRSEERKGLPIVLAGGPCVFNPVPLSPFVDAFVIGDGEAVIPKIANVLRTVKDREEILEAIRDFDGVWVPKFGKYRVKKAVFHHANFDFFPVEHPVPSVSVIHDRISIEAARGCLRGCRFCQAGYIYRPYRERNREKILTLLDRSFQFSGYEEASLSALSISDHSQFNELMPDVISYCYKNMINLSLPSMRVKGFNPELATSLLKLKETSFTIAPEAATDRLRKVINKYLENEDLFSVCEGLFSRGWKRLKLYFMVGLPSETDEDVESISDMLWKIHKIAKRYKGRKNLVAGISVFIPKPFTPFQWEEFIGIEEARRRIDIVLRKAPKSFRVRFHDPRKSFIEAVLTRGGEDTSELLERAFENGCQLDGWDEYFNWDGWLKALEGFDVEALVGKRSIDERLPWDFIDGVVTRDFLLRERERACRGEWTHDCRIVGCHRCGACTPEEIRELKNYPIPEVIDFKLPEFKERLFERKGKVAFTFEKLGFSKYLSLLDLNRVFTRVFRRFGLPLRYKGRFNPSPKISVLFGLPVGVEGKGEIVEVEILDRSFDFQEFVEKSKDFVPDGLRFLDFKFLEGKESLLNRVHYLVYTVRPYKEVDFERVKELSKGKILRTERGKEIRLEEFIKGLDLKDGEISVKVAVERGATLNVRDILLWMGLDLTSAGVVRERILYE